MATSPDGMKKWSESGWRTQQRYNTKVLIGNWAEERKQFRRSDLPTSSSCYEIDFHRFPDSQPDRIQRRSYLKRMEGLPGRHVLSHHGEVGGRHLVSLYDDHYIRRGNSSLPPLRTWDGRSLAWLPERSDFPVTDPPTNFGLLQEKQKLWRDRPSEEQRSVYSASYRPPPVSAFIAPRYGVAPRLLSSTMHRSNNTNKALDFKCQTYLQVPDHPGEHGGNVLVQPTA
ncbi:LOW QUALITY PROTEIN: cilia- and flagella-associated protein 107 [Aquarana catesbeiana]|uniref:LOW QUALITY PROTEIN: cilia- and flagella-associated protein 107 n=1 Tax=Aquarana catesbeiana TaxID=8400 RepID=UPI003CC98A5A